MRARARSHMSAPVKRAGTFTPFASPPTLLFACLCRPHTRADAVAQPCRSPNTVAPRALCREEALRGGSIRFSRQRNLTTRVSKLHDEAALGITGEGGPQAPHGKALPRQEHTTHARARETCPSLRPHTCLSSGKKSPRPRRTWKGPPSACATAGPRREDNNDNSQGGTAGTAVEGNASSNSSLKDPDRFMTHEDGGRG